VKPDHQRLVLGVDGAKGDGCTIAERPWSHVLDWIWTNSEPGQAPLTDLRPMQNHACIEDEQSFRRGKQWVHVDFLDPALLYHQVTEADQELLEGGQINRRAPAYPREGGEDARLFHHVPRQGSGERRECQSAVAIDLHELAA